MFPSRLHTYLLSARKCSRPIDSPSSKGAARTLDPPSSKRPALGRSETSTRPPPPTGPKGPSLKERRRQCRPTAPDAWEAQGPRRCRTQSSGRRVHPPPGTARPQSSAGERVASHTPYPRLCPAGGGGGGTGCCRAILNAPMRSPPPPGPPLPAVEIWE